MSDDRSSLPLTVAVPVDELAYLQRRARYLEAVMLQVLRDRATIREWFPAAELAALRLPGLPHSKAGLARLATAQHWRRRIATGRGGERYEYHVTALPPRAFDNLVERILATLPAPAPITAPSAPEIAAAKPAPAPAVATDAATSPAWLLPLLRLVKTGRAGTLTDICTTLPNTLPRGITAPTREEVAEALQRLGYAV